MKQYLYPGRGPIAVIYPHLLSTILAVHDRIHSGMAYPFFDPACARYEALRAVRLEGLQTAGAIDKYGLTDYGYRKALLAFNSRGVAGLIGLESERLTEELSSEAERMVFVLKEARTWIPATKMRLILQGFGHDIPLSLMRHLYASYGWARGTKPYQGVDFRSLNLKVMHLCELQSRSIARGSFLHEEDHLQSLLEVFRTLHIRGVSKRYAGSRVSFGQHKQDFLGLGLLGLVERARAAFRNSKVGFAEEGRLILSKIQHQARGQAHYQRILQSKKIEVDPTCVTKIFTRWKVKDFQSRFTGDLRRLLAPEAEAPRETSAPLPVADTLRLDRGFVSFLKQLKSEPLALANPGIFLFLPYLNRLRIFDKAACLFSVDPDRGYSWFSLLLLALGRVLQGLSSLSKACRTHELSLPLMAGLVEMPSRDSLLNGLAAISEAELLSLRRHLTQATAGQGLIKAQRVAFDFHMREFTSDDAQLKNIGKAPSPKRKICFPGFRPHLAWDVDTGLPLSLEFRNGSARATTTIGRFIRELLSDTLGEHGIEHVYLDSEYTGRSVWQLIVDSEHGLGADLTMCIKQNKSVKQHIKAFLETKPTWLFYDEEHTYTEQTFTIPIRHTDKAFNCVLKRKESTGAQRCFGSTLKSLQNSRAILSEYGMRWIIENGIKDLVANYFFDNNPGTDPHRINIHYFVVTLARSLYEMLCRDYQEAQNPDGSKKTIGTLRPEFMMGANAVLSREKNELVLTWKDAYPEKHHQPIKALLDRLNQYKLRALPFLGGLKIRFEIVPPKPKTFRNQFRRQLLEI